jgi:hypothetical protein
LHQCQPARANGMQLDLNAGEATAIARIGGA